MAHYERNLESSEACNGDVGVYVARTYFMDGTNPLMRQVDLGHFSHEQETARDIIEETSNRLGEKLKLGQPFAIKDMVAVAVLRECQRRRHQDGTHEDAARLERFSSFIIARNDSGREAIKLPDTKQLRKVSEHGFGHARHSQPGLSTIERLIYLPTTPEENRTYEVVSAYKAGPIVLPLNKQPYVALHTLPESNESIEQIITLEQLR